MGISDAAVGDVAIRDGGDPSLPLLLLPFLLGPSAIIGAGSQTNTVDTADAAVGDVAATDAAQHQ